MAANRPKHLMFIGLISIISAIVLHLLAPVIIFWGSSWSVLLGRVLSVADVPVQQEQVVSSEDRQLRYEYQQLQAEQRQLTAEVQQRFFEDEQKEFEQLQRQAESEGHREDSLYYLHRAQSSLEKAQGALGKAVDFHKEATTDFNSAQEALNQAKQDALNQARSFHEDGNFHGRQGELCPNHPGDTVVCRFRAGAKRADYFYREARNRWFVASLNDDLFSVKYWHNESLFWLSQKQKFLDHLSLHIFRNYLFFVEVLLGTFVAATGTVLLVKYSRQSGWQFGQVRRGQGYLRSFREVFLIEDQWGDLLQRIQELCEEGVSPGKRFITFWGWVILLIHGQLVMFIWNWWDISKPFSGLRGQHSSLNQDDRSSPHDNDDDLDSI